MLAFLFVCGCSSSHIEQAETAANAETAEAGTPMQAAAFDMPYVLSIDGKINADTVIATLTIDYRVVLQAAPTLTITPHGDTLITNQPLVQTLEIPKAPGPVVMEIHLKGTTPGIDVSISQFSEGFGIEVHESWPKATEKRPLEQIHREAPLPTTIEVEGNSITHGIDVTP